MSRKLIYSCVFYNEKYINLLYILLKSYMLFSNYSDDIDYLIMCSDDFKKQIQYVFDILNINVKIWCLEVKNIFEAAYSRLKIFDYQNINMYKKILYLDCDILVTNSINNMLNFELENKLYVLREGNTSSTYYGAAIFENENENNPNCSAFTSGILLFNNDNIIKDFFLKILLHINNHMEKKLTIPICFDQPFIIYNAIKYDLYDNQKLIGLVINNPDNLNNETICHFPGIVGHYISKNMKMINFMNKNMFKIKDKKNYNVLINKQYKWKMTKITFFENNKINKSGKYEFINKYLVKCKFGLMEFLFKFDEDYSKFISVKNINLEVDVGNEL